MAKRKTRVGRARNINGEDERHEEAWRKIGTARRENATRRTCGSPVRRRHIHEDEGPRPESGEQSLRGVDNLVNDRADPVSGVLPAVVDAEEED